MLLMNFEEVTRGPRSPRVMTLSCHMLLIASLLGCPGCEHAPKTECDPEDGETLVCGEDECEQEIPVCVDGRIVARSCDDVDLGEHGEQTCGVGACEVTVPVCRGGEAVTCVPSEPAHFREICGTGVDEDCNGLVDCDDPACIDPRIVFEDCVLMDAQPLETGAGYVLVARPAGSADLIHVPVDVHGDPAGEPVPVFQASANDQLVSYSSVAREQGYLLLRTGISMPPVPPVPWLYLDEVDSGGEVVRSSEIEPPTSEPEAEELAFFSVWMRPLSDGGPYVISTSFGVRHGGSREIYAAVVGADGEMIEPWREYEGGVRLIAANGEVASFWFTRYQCDSPLYDEYEHYCNEIFYQRLDRHEPVLVHEMAKVPYAGLMTREGDVLVALQEYDEDTGMARLLMKRFDESDQLVETRSLVDGVGAFGGLTIAEANTGYWVVFDYSDERGMNWRFHYLHVAEDLQTVWGPRAVGGMGDDRIVTVIDGHDAPRIFFSRRCEVASGSPRNYYLRDMGVCPDAYD